MPRRIFFRLLKSTPFISCHETFPPKRGNGKNETRKKERILYSRRVLRCCKYFRDNELHVLARRASWCFYANLMVAQVTRYLYLFKFHTRARPQTPSASFADLTRVCIKLLRGITARIFLDKTFTRGRTVLH